MSDWFRLDNAALIFPAVHNKNWSNVFRVSAELSEKVDPDILQAAVDALRPRFPSVYVGLHRGMFWFYLQKIDHAPAVQPDRACPLIHMTRHELRECGFRVLYHENRIAVELFHALTDGTGGMIYLKSLTAEYLRRRYGVEILCEEGVLNPLDAPTPAELEDSFVKTAGPVAMSRTEENSLRLSGTPEPDGYHHLTVATLSDTALRDAAHRYGCTVTAFLCAVILETILKIAPKGQRKRWAKMTVPVNLRKLFGSETLRNFALFVNVGVDPRLGAYTLSDLCKAVQSQLSAMITPQKMASMVAANVQSAQMPIVRIMPLPIKNLVLRAVYRSVGESKGTMNLSNLGVIRLPEAMRAYVRTLDFVIGPMSTYHHNCSAVSYGGKTRISLIRNVQESDFEREFLTELVRLGLHVTVESNERND